MKTPEVYGSLNVGEQLCSVHLDNFAGLNANFVNFADSSDAQKAGTILAALQQNGDTSRANALLDQVKPKPEIAAYALGEAMRYTRGEAAEFVMQELDKIDPRNLPIDARLDVMRIITLAKKHANETGEPAPKVWNGYRPGATELLEEVTSQKFVDSRAIANIFQVQPFTEFPDERTLAVHFSRTALDFCNSPAADRLFFAGMMNVSVGEMVASGSMSGLRKMSVDQAVAFAVELTKTPKFSQAVSVEAEFGFHRENPEKFGQFYEAIQINRPNLVYTDELDKNYSQWLAKYGDIDQGLTLSSRLHDYENFAWVRMIAAERLHNSGQHERAVVLLEEALAADPIAIEPFDDGDEDVFDTMPDVDENDPVSIDRFNQEASLRSEMRSKSSHELTTERGYMLEWIAERGAKIGEYGLALRAYGQSRRYPMQTDHRLARIAIEHDELDEYVDAIFTTKMAEYEGLELGYKTGMFEALGIVLINEVPTNPNTRLLPETGKRIITFCREAMEIDAGALCTPKYAAKAMAYLGGYEEAVALNQMYESGKHIGYIAVAGMMHAANTGEPRDALAIYDSLPSDIRVQRSYDLKVPLRNIILRSVAPLDEKTIQSALAEITDHDKVHILSSLAYESPNHPAVPAWLAKTAIGDYPTDIGRIAYYLKKYGGVHPLFSDPDENE